MMRINHSSTSQGLPSSLWVGVSEAKPSGGDEPGFYVRVERASSHEDQHFTPKGAIAFVLPIDELWWVPHSDALQAE
jgi:hypothetical protein